MGVPPCEVEGSWWNSADRGICGTHREVWQVRNNQWQVGNNVAYFRHLTTLFHLLLHMMTMWVFFLSISPSGYHSNSFDCFFGSIIDNHDETTCKFLFSINFRYFHISFNFPKGRKAGRFFLLIVHPQVMWSASHTPSIRAPPVCSICLRDPPTQGEVKCNGLFWIGRVNCKELDLWRDSFVQIIYMQGRAIGRVVCNTPDSTPESMGVGFESAPLTSTPCPVVL